MRMFAPKVLLALQPTQLPTFAGDPSSQLINEYNPAVGVIWGLLTSLTILISVVVYQFLKNR